MGRVRGRQLGHFILSSPRLYMGNGVIFIVCGSSTLLFLLFLVSYFISPLGDLERRFLARYFTDQHGCHVLGPEPGQVDRHQYAVEPSMRLVQ